MKIDIIDNDGNIKNVLDEENNFIDKNRIKFLHKKFFNLKFYYFYLGNTLNFYFPFTTNIFHNNKNLNPPFSLNKNFAEEYGFSQNSRYIWIDEEDSTNSWV